MLSKSRKLLGQILLEKKLITLAELELALVEQQVSHEFLGTILIKHSIIREGDLLQSLSEQFGIPVVTLKDAYIRWEFVRQFSPALILDHTCFPVSSDEWSVTFAIINPLDLWARRRAEDEAGALRAKFVLVAHEDMDEVLMRYRQYMRGNIDTLF